MFAIDFYTVWKHLRWGLFWYTFNRIITWRKIDNLVRFRTKSFYHLNIGTFSLNMCGSKLEAVWLTDVNVLSHFILFTFFTILLPDWSKAWKGFAVSSYQTVACNVISDKEISNAFDKLKITFERSSVKANTPRNMFNFLFLIQNGSYNS